MEVFVLVGVLVLSTIAGIGGALAALTLLMNFLEGRDPRNAEAWQNGGLVPVPIRAESVAVDRPIAA